MGHRIDAIVFKGPYDRKFASLFGLKPLRLTDELTLFPISARYFDHWAARFEFEGGLDSKADFPLLNGEVVARLVSYLAADPLYAVIHTNYFGGPGEQAAAVYRGKVELMPCEGGSYGPINKALRLLGVTAAADMDEFDTVGLGAHRRLDEPLEVE